MTTRQNLRTMIFDENESFTEKISNTILYKVSMSCIKFLMLAKWQKKFVFYKEDLLTYKNLQTYATKDIHMYNVKYNKMAA